MKKMTFNTMYIVQELHAFVFNGTVYSGIVFNEIKSHYKAFHFHQYFRYTLQVIYQLFYFYN